MKLHAWTHTPFDYELIRGRSLVNFLKSTNNCWALGWMLSFKSGCLTFIVLAISLDIAKFGVRARGVLYKDSWLV